MSKQRKQSTMVQPLALPPLPVGAPALGVPVSEEAPAKYDFGRTRRCPRCCSTNSRLRSVDGQHGWRDCQVATCRHAWKVLGQRI